MELCDQTFENEWVKLELIKPKDEFHEVLKLSSVMDSFWRWMPRLSGRGTTVGDYYDDALAQHKAGTMMPLMATCQSTGSFAGGATFLRMSRTHRRVQIDYVWTPENKRGSSAPLAIQTAMLRGCCGLARQARILDRGYFK